MIPLSVDRSFAPSTLPLLLQRPGALLWPDNEKELLAVRKKHRTSLPHEHRALIDLSILTAFLLKGVNEKKANQIDNQPGIIQKLFALLSDLDPVHILNATWGAVPVAGTAPGNQSAATITWCIVGCLAEQPKMELKNPWPGWVQDRTDNKARGAIKSAFLAAQRLTGKSNQLYIYPLCSIDGNGSLLRGRSLGLPVAIAAALLLWRAVPKQNFLATGDIKDQDGTVGQVNRNSLRAKGLAAIKAQLSLFLYPRSKIQVHDLPTGVFAQPVSTLGQAFMWADCYSEGNSLDIQRLDTALQSERDLVNGIDNLPANLLEWLKTTGRAERLINAVIEDNILSEQLADKLDVCLKQAEGNFQLASSIAELVVNKEQIVKMGAANPVATLSWCSSNLALANLSGANQIANSWSELGMRWVDQASRRDDKGRWLSVEFFNRRFGIAERHNIYLFKKNLPRDFIVLLRNREKRHRVDCALTECSDYILGSMYGTIAQNLAFCGPENISETIEYLEKARKVFGRENTKDIRQEYSYQYFALLDAGPAYAEDAAKCLLASLGFDSFENVQFYQLRPFGHYGLLRAIIEIPEQLPRGCVEKFKNLAFAKFASINTFVPSGTPPSAIHPWQFWCYNLGRLARQTDNKVLAKEAWRKSCELCARGGETLNVMALLPLAALFQNKLTEPEDMEKASKIIQLIRGSKTLHKEHFKSLLSSRSPEKVLRLVAEHPDKYFPFNYR